MNSASTVLRGGRNTIYREVERFSSTQLVEQSSLAFIQQSGHLTE
ncbi:hypothetical protein [Bacillus sp. sid0103]|nr:hypothetical protein [Bacillus sp. sid0103]